MKKPFSLEPKWWLLAIFLTIFISGEVIAYLLIYSLELSTNSALWLYGVILMATWLVPWAIITNSVAWKRSMEIPITNVASGSIAISELQWFTSGPVMADPSNVVTPCSDPQQLVDHCSNSGEGIAQPLICRITITIGEQPGISFASLQKQAKDMCDLLVSMYLKNVLALFLGSSGEHQLSPSTFSGSDGELEYEVVVNFISAG